MLLAHRLRLTAAGLLLAGSVALSAAPLTGAQVITGTPDTAMATPNPLPVPTALVPTGGPGTLPDTPNTPNVTTATGVDQGSTGAPGTGAGSDAPTAPSGEQVVH